MATEPLIEDVILDLLIGQPEGLLADDIHVRLQASRKLTLRSLQLRLKKMTEESRVIRIRRSTSALGKPPFAYFHPDELPKQGSFLDQLVGARTEIQTKTDLAEAEVDDEQRRLNTRSRSVMEQIAHEHLNQDAAAWAIVQVAPLLSAQDPVDLLLEMAQWVVDDINGLVNQMLMAVAKREMRTSGEIAAELDGRLEWARKHLQQMWRLDAPRGDEPGILFLPSRAKDCRYGETASLDAEAAKERLRQRVFGKTVIELRRVPLDLHKSAAGTDASVADIFLEHSQGSFIPPEPIAVITAGAALTNREYPDYAFQDFDVFPDRLKEYTESRASEEGLLLSPALRHQLPEDGFKHSRMAAMDLRQYYEDFRIVNREADWRPIGGIPAMGIESNPSLVIRDGRIFPLVHRIEDYEDTGLYGRLVKKEIDLFAKVAHQTLSGPTSHIVYGAAVKDPEMSFLAPLIFWFIHQQDLRKTGGELVVSREDVYRIPFGDTAVAHLLFLGWSKAQTAINMTNASPDEDYVFVTFRAVRRFSDIGIKNGPAFIEAENRWVNEDDREDWKKFIAARYSEHKRRNQRVRDPADYSYFLYLLEQVGVSMFYAAPAQPLEIIKHTSEGRHFLLPRLEVAFGLQQRSQEEEKFIGLISWIAEHWEFDDYHSQSKFDTGNRDSRLPILVPDVTRSAHEVVTYARDVLGEEVQDRLRELIQHLRKQMKLD
ncbi:hypothetical protein H6F43_03715 [Leptolyngbya sp. FACHB-36]|uniref:hypothetical protein n=1 Tax=Leptolyngbya sp. FACHB-36 TaxID=2692808 RepID=UPI0016815311|nr:hypothetical protein [Leptolyngbya sp. FACHB-36]MBD2019289.1 hypothetical protein [Leptolyngbya sp. FACHB-36]